MNSFDLQVQAFPGEHDDVTGYLVVLFTPGTSNYSQLKYEVQREYRFSGSPEVTSMKFERVNYNHHTGKGSFRVVLDINFTFGCEDVQTEKIGQTSDWTFELDRANALIHFYGSPYIDSRSTADEF